MQVDGSALDQTLVMLHPENLPKLRHAKELVHFHSDFSLLIPFWSSSTSGTQPPKMYILLAMSVAECRDRGRGAIPPTTGRSHVRVPALPKMMQVLAKKNLQLNVNKTAIMSVY
jgi:hypothetical protein